MIQGGDHPPTPEQAEKIWRLLWVSFGDRRISNGWYEHQAWYPAHCWLAAIREAGRSGKSIGGIKYIETIAARYAVEGVPDEKPAAPRSSKSATKRSQTRQAIDEATKDITDTDEEAL